MANTAEVMEIDDDEPVATASITTAPVPVVRAEDNEDIVETAQPVATTAAACPATPRKLYDLPEIADRYAPIRSTIDDVVYRDPSKFSLKPPFWERWKTDEYRKFAQYLECFDLVPLARELGKPVEEVYHMYHAVVTKPLYDARKANNKGLQGMKGWFKLYNEYGTPSRVWAEDEDRRGELDDITHRTIHLILQKTGTKCKVKLEELREDDFEWIQENIEERNRQILSGFAVGDPWKKTTTDGLPRYEKRPDEETLNEKTLDQKTLKRKLSPEPATPAKQARLTENGNATAPAKMRSTPSAFAATPQATRGAVSTVETPSGSSKQRQVSVVAEAPTPSKAKPVVVPSTPMVTKMVRLRVTSPRQFDYRSWTAASVVARFEDTSPGCVILVERTTLRRLTVPFSALDRADKDWLNARTKQELISIDRLKLLKKGKAPVQGFEIGKAPVDLHKYWTEEGIVAKYSFVSRLKLHLEREDPGEGESRMVTITIADLTTEDKAWLKENISLTDRQTLSDHFGKQALREAQATKAARAASQSTSGPSIDADADYVVVDSSSDKAADYESEGSDIVRTQKRGRGPVTDKSLTLGDRSMSAAVTDRDSAMGGEDGEEIAVAGSSTVAQNLAVRAASKAPDAIIADDNPPLAQETQSEAGSGSGSGSSSDSDIDEPYEVITGAPIRQWTDFNLVGNLVGVAERKAIVRVEGREELERLSMERWSRADLNWVMEYLVKDQKRILSGKAKVGGVA